MDTKKTGLPGTSAGGEYRLARAFQYRKKPVTMDEIIYGSERDNGIVTNPGHSE